MINDFSNIHFEASNVAETSDDRLFKEMKYARIFELIAEKQHISLKEAMEMLYSSTLFEIIDDGTAYLVCHSNLCLDDEIVHTYITTK